jgi:predicted glutamine amidotransferase
VVLAVHFPFLSHVLPLRLRRLQKIDMYGNNPPKFPYQSCFSATKFARKAIQQNSYHNIDGYGLSAGDSTLRWIRKESSILESSIL